MNGMNPNPPEKKDNPLTLMLNTAWHAIRHNLGFKILATVLAVALWAGLITQDPTLTREKRFDNVSVSVIGTDTMKRSGFVVISDLNQLLSGVTLRADVPQNNYLDAQASSYNARIDLSRIREKGEQEVRVLTTNSISYGSVQEVSPSVIKLVVDEYVTRYRIPVNVETQGELPAGYVSSGQTIDPALLTVSGPKSIVDTIVRAEAVIDHSMLAPKAGKVSNSIKFRLVNGMGEAVQSDLLEITTGNVLVDSVIVEQTLFPTKKIELSDMGIVIGTPAAGYEIKNVSYTPAVIEAAGNPEDLEALDQLFTSTAVDVTGKSESFHSVINVRKPSQLQSLSPSSVTVAVEIGPVIRSRTFENIRYTLTGQSDSTNVSWVTRSGSVTVTGPQLWVESLRSNVITLSCDVEGLDEGTYTLPLVCTIASDEPTEYSLEPVPAEVTVTIKKK